MRNRTGLSSVHTLLHSSMKLYFLKTQRKKIKEQEDKKVRNLVQATEKQAQQN